MSNQNSARSYPDDLVIRRVHYWSAGALRQGERLIALIESQSKYGNTPSEWTPDQAREQHEANALAWDHLVEELEGDFFVHAVRQLLLWLEQARAHGALSAAEIDAFENDTPHVKDLRDMRAHEDEYLAGVGRRQAAYEHPFGSLEVSAHGIAVGGADDDYSIGGRLSVPKTLASLRRLVTAVEAVRRPPSPPTFNIGVMVG